MTDDRGTVALSPGTRLGPYEIDSLIGAGGMGQVYKARDTRLGRVVAIKLLSPEVADRPDRRRRFETEARSISSLSHPHICALFDVGEIDGRAFLVMEHLEGETLEDRLTRGPLPSREVLRMGTQIADALDHAHRARIVHRDLKPSNVMLTQSGPKLLDFGLAKRPETKGAAAGTTVALDNRRLTAEGAMIGTLHYMAPEQLDGDDGWTFVDRSFPAGFDALQYERIVQGEFGMDAASILRTYPASSFATPKDALARLTTDAEFVCENRRVARVMHHDGAPVYVYSFDYAVSAVNAGRAFHGIDSNFLFGNNFGAPSNHVLTAADLALYDAMSTYWRRFMETGDPNARGVPVQWPPYRPGPSDPPADASRADRHFVFADRLGVGGYLRDSQCNFWESFNFRSVVGAVPAAAR